LISVGVVDEAEHHHGVIACCLQAFRNERSAAIRSLAGHSSELRQALIEQALPMIDRRFGARSGSFGIFICFCFCLLGPFLKRFIRRFRNRFMPFLVGVSETFHALS
jgi:hypothetical protein